MPVIHPTAVVMPGAVLAEDVEVGPLCFVGPDVKIGAGTRLIAQCHVSGHTELGKNNVLHPFCAIGGPAQDHGVVPGEISYIKIGDNNVFRENSTVHSGTKPGTTTVIGSDCMFMQCTHVAHNCQIGNRVIMVGGAVVAGYCQIGDSALISGKLCGFTAKSRYSTLLESKRLSFVVAIPSVDAARSFSSERSLTMISSGDKTPLVNIPFVMAEDILPAPMIPSLYLLIKND